MSREADVLERAADVLVREGWTQRTGHEPGVGYCATGATWRACGWRNVAVHYRAVDLFGAYLVERDRSMRLYGLYDRDQLARRKPGANLYAVQAVNDRWTMTAQTMIRLLREAAAWLNDDDSREDASGTPVVLPQDDDGILVRTTQVSRRSG